MLTLIADYIWYAISLIFISVYIALHLIVAAYRMKMAAATVVGATQHAVHVAQHRAVRKGRVVSTDELLRAPLSGHECIMYEFEILRIDGDPICDHKVTNFILEDGGERVFVYGQSIRMEHEFDLVLNDPDPQYKSVLAKYGIDYHDWQVYKVVSVRERYVAPGQQIQLSGSFELRDAKPPILQPVMGTHVSLTKV